MTGEHNSQTWTQSDAFAEVISAERCHFVLETSPPDYVKKISRYLESSVGQSSQNKVSNGPAEADSDSGDSLFITQRPVPEAVRSGRRRHSSLRSKPASPRDHEESEEDNSSSASPGESRTDKEKRRKTYTLPKYSFPFLAERKHRRTLLPVQNASLHKYVMGGFFKCVRELWQGYQRGVDEESFLPTVDIDGEDIAPLSEEDEERSGDGDITVVERKCFAAPSKAKSQQTWCNQLKQQRRRRASDATQETSQGRKTKVLHKIPAEAAILKDVPVSDTESSHNGESSCRVLVHRERNDEHAAANGNFLAQTETPKSKRRLRFEQKARQEELRNDNDATVCGPRKQLRSLRQITQKGREASSTVPDVLHTDDVLQAGQPRDGPESQNLQKKKKDGRDNESVEDGKGQDEPEGLHAAVCVNVEVEETNDELQIHEKNGTENSSHDDTILKQEERDSPDSKHKKERRKKNKPAVENVRQEVDGNVESDVRVQNSVFSVSCNMEEDVKEKKKKKKKKRTVEQSVAEPRNDDAEIQKKKKKKRKKEKGIVTTEEDEEASDRTSVSAEQLQESGNCLENAAASQETSESSYVKRKKHKKKRRSSSNDATQDGEQGVDVSVCSDDPVTWADGSGMSLKKTKRESMFCTPDEDEKVDKVGKKTKEDTEDQDAELVTKKKKKKQKKEMSSVSVQEKEKKRTSSFLVADAEENDTQTHGEQISPSQSCVSGAEKPAVSAGDLEEVTDGVTKKKRKRLVEQDFEEPNKACRSVLPETPDTGVKRKKKHTGSSARLSPADEAVVLKKKKCKHRVIQEGPPAATEDAESVISALNTCSSVSHKKKGKHGRSAEISHDSSASDRATEETPNVVQHDSASSEMSGNQALNDMRDNKKKRKVKSADDVLLEGKLSKSAELDPRENKKKERNEQSADPSGDTSSQTSHSKSEMSSSDSITKNSHRKVKRRLHNPSEDFLTDY